MTSPGSRPRPEVAARVRAEVERRLDAQELAELLAIPVDRDEREDVLSLVAWFRRRYPNPADRLAYVRRDWSLAVLDQLERGDINVAEALERLS